MNSCYLLFILRAFLWKPRRWILYPFLKASSSIKYCNNNKAIIFWAGLKKKAKASYRWLALYGLNHELKNLFPFILEGGLIGTENEDEERSMAAQMTQLLSQAIQGRVLPVRSQRPLIYSPLCSKTGSHFSNELGWQRFFILQTFVHWKLHLDLWSFGENSPLPLLSDGF